MRSFSCQGEAMMRKLFLCLILLFAFVLSVFGAKNLSDFPLQIRVLESHWHYRNGGVDGWGRGVLNDGKSVKGFDFTYESDRQLLRTVGGAHYLAKWKKDPLKLEMIVGEIGEGSKYHTYELKTSVRDDV